MALTFFITGLLIIAAAVFFAVKNRHNTKKWIACVTAGVFFSSFFMILPTQWLKEGQKASFEWLYRIASSLMFSFKALSGRPELLQIESIPFEGVLKNIYIVINYVSFIAAPILTSSLIISFFGDTAEKIKYFFRGFSKKCCVFSELNENSLALAKSIKKERGRETLVFCGAKGVDAALAEKARKIGGILLYRSCVALKPSRRFGVFEYYLISEAEDDNIKSAEEIIARENKRKSAPKKPAVVNTFFRTSTKIEVLEDLAAGDRVRLRFINEIALFCNDLVFRHPLYDLPEGRRDISVMIVGCGSWGMQMLKTAICNGQIDGYSLKIRVYDVDAEHRENVFRRQCPEIEKLGADLKFIRADVRTNAFFELLKSEENGCLDATYCCVATCSDDVNLEISENLYRFFRKENGFSYTPPIFTRVRNDEITENMAGRDKTYLKKRGIELFGTARSFYADGTLFNTYLERLTLGVHLIYWSKNGKTSLLKKYSENERDPDCAKALNSFYGSEYSRRSSMSAVLHFGAKVLSVCNKKDETFLRGYGEEVRGINDIKAKKEKLKAAEKERKNTEKEIKRIEKKPEQNIDPVKKREELKAIEKKTDELKKSFMPEEIKKELDGKKKELERVLDAYSLAISEEKKDGQSVLDKMLKNEHDRWCYFMATEGFQRASQKDVELFNAGLEKPDHKDTGLSKSHPCLIPYEELDGLSEWYNEFAKNRIKASGKTFDFEDKDFRNEDRKIITELPNIIRFANGLPIKEDKNVQTETV